MDNELTNCRRADHIDCFDYKKCLGEAAKLNLAGIFCQDCTDYEKDPDFISELREHCYLAKE